MYARIALYFWSYWYKIWDKITYWMVKHTIMIILMKQMTCFSLFRAFIRFNLHFYSLHFLKLRGSETLVICFKIIIIIDNYFILFKTLKTSSFRNRVYINLRFWKLFINLLSLKMSAKVCFFSRFDLNKVKS